MDCQNVSTLSSFLDELSPRGGGAERGIVPHGGRQSRSLGSGQDPIWFPSLYLAHVWLHGYCLCTAVATPRATVLTDRLNFVSEPKGHCLRVGTSSPSA